MAGELAGALREVGVGHGRLRVAIGDFVAARGGVPAQQFRDRRDQIGVQHRFPQTMLKPPLMLITWPVIQPLCGEASSATIGATSSGRPSRRSG